jgi:hypothetical protein
MLLGTKRQGGQGGFVETGITARFFNAAIHHMAGVTDRKQQQDGPVFFQLAGGERVARSLASFCAESLEEDGRGKAMRVPGSLRG